MLRWLNVSAKELLLALLSLQKLYLLTEPVIPASAMTLFLPHLIPWHKELKVGGRQL